MQKRLNPLPDTEDERPGRPPDLYSRISGYRLESIFSCGAFVPLPAASGSIRLQIENGPSASPCLCSARTTSRGRGGQTDATVSARYRA